KANARRGTCPAPCSLWLLSCRLAKDYSLANLAPCRLCQLHHQPGLSDVRYLGTYERNVDEPGAVVCARCHRVSVDSVLRRASKCQNDRQGNRHRLGFTVGLGRCDDLFREAAAVLWRGPYAIQYWCRMELVAPEPHQRSEYGCARPGLGRLPSFNSFHRAAACNNSTDFAPALDRYSARLTSGMPLLELTIAAASASVNSCVLAE